MIAQVTLYIALFFASLGLNWLVGWMERNGVLNGYKGIMVVFGVIYTLVGIWFVEPVSPVMILAFIFSLTPVVGGDIARHIFNQLETAKLFEKTSKRGR